MVFIALKMCIRDSTKVQADYAFKQHVSNGGGNSNDGFGVSLQHDLSNKAALQYSCLLYTSL